MKTIQIVFNCGIFIAVIILYILFFNNNKQTSQPNQMADVTLSTEHLPIAFLNTDSLLLHYKFAQEASDKLQTKQEDARLKLNTRARTLQQEMADFQRKLENNAFLSRERAESEQKRLLKKQQELEELENQLTQEIMEENQKLNKRLADTLINYLKIFNADERFHMVFANNSRDNILMATPQYDITKVVIDALNERYSDK